MKNLKNIVKYFVKKNYDFEPNSIKIYKEGIASINLLVSDSYKSFVIRCDLGRTKDEVKDDFIFQQATLNNGVNVPEIPKFIEKIDNIVITGRRLVNGDLLSKLSRITPCMAKLLGEQLGLIHTTKCKHRRNGFYEFIYSFNENKLDLLTKSARQHPNNNLRILSEKIADNILKSKHVLIDKSIKLDSLIHSDYKLSNILITPLSKIVILDWEKACLGPPLFDLGLALFHFCSNERLKHNLKVLEFYLQGYILKNNSITSELFWLPDVILIAALTFILVDIAQAAENVNKPKHMYNPKREKYFNTYCYPTYLIFDKNKKIILGLVRDTVKKLVN